MATDAMLLLFFFCSRRRLCHLCVCVRVCVLAMAVGIVFLLVIFADFRNNFKHMTLRSIERG